MLWRKPLTRTAKGGSKAGSMNSERRMRQKKTRECCRKGNGGWGAVLLEAVYTCKQERKEIDEV